MPREELTLAARIKDYRLMKELTHKDAAEALGIGQNTYYRILRGERVTDRIRAIVKNRLNGHGIAA